MPVKLCAFDVETQGRNPEFVCGSIFSDEEVGYYTNPSEMIDMMRRHARKGYTFLAHNAEYDIATLLWSGGEDVSIRYTNETYATASWLYGAGKRRATIWDSIRLSSGLSLHDLGAAIGCAKLDRPRRLIDATDIRRDWVCESHGVPGCFECYCVRDAEIVWSYANSLREWLGDYGLSLHYSLARTAIDLWQLFDPGAVQTIKTEQVRKLARQSYHGGRCEVFRYGSIGRVYTGDFRQFYGSILRTIELPDVPSLRYSSGDVAILHADETDGIVRARVSIDPQFVPPLPVGYQDRVFYPVGRCSGVWPIRELRAACQGGVTVEQVEDAYYTDQKTKPFFTTAGVLVELREYLRSQQDARELACKFLINAIPGRLGMKEETEIVSYRRWRNGTDASQLNGAELERVGSALFLARRHSIRKPSRTSNVMWASCITAEGRIRLYQKLLQAGEHLLYCDTDSVHSLSPLACDGEMPGMFRDTGVYDSGIYLGSKFYSLETDTGDVNVRAKGIPREFAREFIRNKHVAYQTTLGVADGILRGIGPCVWVDTERVASYAPGTRTIVDPGVFSGASRSSQTTPVAFGSMEDVGTTEFLSGIL